MSWNNVIPWWVLELEMTEDKLRKGVISLDEALLIIEKSSALPHVKRQNSKRFQLIYNSKTRNENN